MKILKKILIVLLVIIAIPLIMALFVSNEFKGENTVKINKPVQEVYDYVKYLDNQENFWCLVSDGSKHENLLRGHRRHFGLYL